MPRFKCEFCKKRGIKRKIEWHEKLCYRNPNRVCFACNNTKEVKGEPIDGYPEYKIECSYCKRFDPDFIKKLEEPEEINLETDLNEIPL